MRTKIILLFILALVVFSFAGCGQADVEEPGNDLASNENVETNDELETSEDLEIGDDLAVIGEWSITVEVVGEEPFEFTNEDAAAIGPVEIVAAMKDGDDVGEEETWVGILLNDFLDYINVDEFSVVIVEAADGFSRELEPDRISPDGTGLGWMVNGEKLSEDKGPVQLINHNRGPKWWVEQVSKITIIK